MFKTKRHHQVVFPKFKKLANPPSPKKASKKEI